MPLSRIDREIIHGIVLITGLFIIIARGASTFRACQTQCDCYQNSGLDEVSNMHLCFECSRTHANTCSLVARCQPGYMCTLDPKSATRHSDQEVFDLQALARFSPHRSTNGTWTKSHSYQVLELTCLTPEEAHDECYDNSDCTYTISDTHTVAGFCMPFGKCRYPTYSVINTTLQALENSRHPLDHTTCQARPKPHCKNREDCLVLALRNNSIQDANVWCDTDHLDKSGKGQRQYGTCTTIEEYLSKNVLREVTRKTLLGDTEGEVCSSDTDCYHHARLSGSSNGAQTCYACMLTANDSDLTPKRTCVRTHSDCQSGMCLHGQCMVKACSRDIDCVEVAGSRRHCHRCDTHTGYCKASKICGTNALCTSDTELGQHCTQTFVACNTTTHAAQAQGGGNRWNAGYSDFKNCIPLGALESQMGYIRKTNFELVPFGMNLASFHRQHGAELVVMAGLQAMSNPKTSFISSGQDGSDFNLANILTPSILSNENEGVDEGEEEGGEDETKATAPVPAITTTTTPQQHARPKLGQRPTAVQKPVETINTDTQTTTIQPSPIALPSTITNPEPNHTTITTTHPIVHKEKSATNTQTNAGTVVKTQTTTSSSNQAGWIVVIIIAAILLMFSAYIVFFSKTKKKKYIVVKFTDDPTKVKRKG